MTADLAQAPAGTIRIGAHVVPRLGLGTMRLALTRNAQGERDRAAACALVRHAFERGVRFFDTANIYGLGRSEELLAEALRPYPADEPLVATKAGFVVRRLEPGEKRLPADGRPERIKQECRGSLRRLGRDRIDLFQLHTPDPSVPFADSVGALAELKADGLIRAVGLSNVTAEQLAEAHSIVEVVSVQNRYDPLDHNDDAVLRACEDAGVVFIPWRPLAEGPETRQLVDDLARRLDVAPPAVLLAWLLRRSPVMVPIPATTDHGHLDENLDAAWLELTDADLAAVRSAGSS